MSFNPGLESQFEKAVEIAAARAAQRVARLHRLRLVRWTFITAMLTTFAVILALWFTLIGPGQRTFSRNEATYTCHLFQHTAQTMADFVQVDTTLRAKELALSTEQQVLQGDYKLYGKSLVVKLIKQSNRDNQAAINHWRQVDIPRLTHVQGIDCVTALGG